MATLYSDLAVYQIDGANTLAHQNDPEYQLAKVGWVTAIYTMVGTEAATDIIYVIRLNAGTLVHPYGYVSGDGIAGTATCTVGDTDTQGGTVSADVDKYSTALNVAASTANAQWTGGVQVTTPIEIVDDQCWLTVRLATLLTPVAGKKLVIRVPIIGVP